jgi:hypothetical protein
MQAGTLACIRNGRSFPGGTILTLIITDVLIWRAWLTASPGEVAARPEGLGIAAGVASLTTVALTVCILSRALQLRSSAQAPPAILMKTTSAALLDHAAAVIGAIILPSSEGKEALFGPLPRPFWNADNGPFVNPSRGSGEYEREWRGSRT